MRRVVSWALIASLLLTGCDNTPRQPMVDLAEDVPDDIYRVAPLPEPEPEIEVAPPPPPPKKLPSYESLISPDEMGEEASRAVIEREKAAATLRGKRIRANQTFFEQDDAPESLPETVEWDFSQKYFNRFDSDTPQDVSSYPLDNDYIITEDTLISVILQKPVYSQIGGKVIATVEKDVVSDSREKILIPQGSNVICHYKPLEGVGQDRLPMACTRVITPPPGRVNINLTHAHISDQEGRAGAIGDIDNRFLQKYGGAVAMSLVSVMPYMLIKDKKNNNSNVNVSNVQNYQADNTNPAAKILSKNLTDVTAQILKENIDIKRTISIPAGARLQLELGQDIIIRPPVKKQKRPSVKTKQEN